MEESKDKKTDLKALSQEVHELHGTGNCMNCKFYNIKSSVCSATKGNEVMSKYLAVMPLCCKMWEDVEYTCKNCIHFDKIIGLTDCRGRDELDYCANWDNASDPL